MKKVHALIIVPEIPYPPKNGWHVRLCSIINLISSDIYCDIVAVAKNKELFTNKLYNLLRNELQIKKLKV